VISVVTTYIELSWVFYFKICTFCQDKDQYHLDFAKNNHMLGVQNKGGNNK